MFGWKAVPCFQECLGPNCVNCTWQSSNTGDLYSVVVMHGNTHTHTPAYTQIHMHMYMHSPPPTHTHMIVLLWIGMYTSHGFLSPPERCSDSVADCKECREEVDGTTITCTSCNPGFILDVNSNKCNNKCMFLSVCPYVVCPSTDQLSSLSHVSITYSEAIQHTHLVQ